MPVTITGTRTQQFAPGGDTDGDGAFDPGELVRVILRIVNSGDQDATGVTASDPFNGTTLNPGSVHITPIAVNDSFNITGNTPITFTAAQLLGNDLDPLGNTATLQITAVSGATNGSIVNNGNGTFTFTPTTGLDIGQSASFQYTITDQEGLTNVTGFNGVVTLNITDVIWHVDSAYAGANGASDGSYLRPFTSLTELNGVTGDGTTNDDVDSANEAIFINNRGTNYGAGIVLEAGQRLFGDGAAVSANGIALGVSAGNSTINFSGTGISLATNNTISGISLNGTAGGGTGIVDNGNVGNLVISGSSIAGFGRALSIANGGNLNVNFDTLSSSTSTSQGVVLSGGVSGTFSATTGTIANSAASGFQVGQTGLANSGGTVTATYGGAITNASGAAVQVENHASGNVTFSGAITDSTAGGASQIIVNNNTGGSVNFTGAVNVGSTTAAAVNLTNNTGATINFNTTGTGLDITSSLGTAFNATGGGTINVTGAGNSISTTSGTGTGVNIVSTTIGGSGVRFDSVSTNGATNGIVLSNTGSGTFTVSGTGVANSGGTINRSVGTGISLNNTGPVSLTGITVSNGGNTGIDGTTVNGLTLSGVTVISNGNAVGERGVYINGLTGTGTITGSTFTGSFDHNVNLINNGGTLNLTVTNSQFRNSNGPNGNDGLLLESNGTAVTTASITGSTFDNNAGDHFQFATNGTGGATGSQNNITFSGNTLTTSNSANILGGGVTISPSGGDDLVALISNNTITGHRSGGAINVAGVNTITGSNIQVTVSNNTIGTAGVASSGSAAGGSGILTQINGDGTLTALVDNNRVYEINGTYGIYGAATNGTAAGRAAGGAQLNLTLTNNTVANTAGTPLNLVNAVRVEGGTAAGTSNELIQTQISGNSVHTTTTTGTDIRVRAASASNSAPAGAVSFQLRGYTGAATDLTAVANYIQTQNAGSIANAAPSLAGGLTANGTFSNTPGGAAVPLPGTPAAPLLAVVQLPQSGATDLTVHDTSGVVPFTPVKFASGSIADRFGLFGEGPANTHVTIQLDDNGNVIGQTLDPVAIVLPAEPESVASPETAAPSAPTSFDLTPIAAPETGILTQAALDAVVAAAIQRWVATGVSDAQLAALQAVHFDVADLPGIYLGTSSANGIQLDSDGAGFGWFIDKTPGDDVEFGGSGTALTGLNGIAASRIDLLTVVLHELGHAIGLEDTYLSSDSSNLLYGYINPGVRRLPADGQAAGAVPGSVPGEAFALGATAIGTLAAGRAVEITFDSTINTVTNQVIVNPSSASTISGSNFATVTSNTQTLTLDTLTLGGSIFIDTNRDGLQNNGEVGPSGVALTLFADTNNNNAFDAGDVQLTTGTTGANGVYSFANLAPGNYIVRVDAANLTGGGALTGRISTTGGSDPDNNISGDSNGSAITAGIVTSQAITLAYNTEPTAGVGNDTNNTLGFGFFTPSSAGNDFGTATESTTTSIAILTNDSDPGNTLTINQINGVTLTAGQSTTLASGAIVTRNADNTLTYNPNGVFNYLVSPATATATGAANGSAIDTFSYTLVGGGSATVSVTVNGVDSAGDQLRGDVGNNTLTGTPGVDFFNLSQGGNDTVNGGGGNDAFYFGGAFAAGDIVDGGAGTNDQVALQGNYAITFAANAFTNVEVIALLSSSVNTYGGGSASPYSYNIVTNDANVAVGQELVVFAQGLAANESFTFNGAAETNGNFRIFAGQGADTLTGGAGNDGFYFGPGAFNPATDTINGGAGTNDQVALDGNYTATITGTQFQNVEVLALLRGIVGDLANYNLTFTDSLVGAGQTLTVFALPVLTNLTLNASAETNGNYTIIGGQANDTITTGSGNDSIFGGLGADVLNGGAGADTFVYNGSSESSGPGFDTIVGFVSGVDRIDAFRTITAIDATVTSGSLSAASFNADLTAALGGGQFGADHAVLFTPTSGSFAGATFLVIDGDGAAGYNFNSDLVIQLTTPPASLVVGDFI